MQRELRVLERQAREAEEAAGMLPVRICQGISLSDPQTSAESQMAEAFCVPVQRMEKE